MDGEQHSSDDPRAQQRDQDGYLECHADQRQQEKDKECHRNCHSDGERDAVGEVRYGEHLSPLSRAKSSFVLPSERRNFGTGRFNQRRRTCHRSPSGDVAINTFWIEAGPVHLAVPCRYGPCGRGSRCPTAGDLRT